MKKSGGGVQVVLQEPLQVCIDPHRVLLEMLGMVAMSVKAILLVVLIGVCIGAGTKVESDVHRSNAAMPRPQATTHIHAQCSSVIERQQASSSASL